MDLLILQGFALLPFFESFLWNLLACPREHGVGSHTSLELFELSFNFGALGLLFVQLCLQFRGHLVVPVLCFLEIDTHLMDICKCVKILVLVHWAVCLLILGVVVGLNGNDALL